MAAVAIIPCYRTDDDAPLRILRKLAIDQESATGGALLLSW